jgi:hypothetical protein
MMIDDAQAAGSVRLFLVRHEFPTEWARFIKSDNTEAIMTLEIREEHFPYWSMGSSKTIKSVDIFARDDINSKGFSHLDPAGTGELITYGSDGKKRTDSLKALTDIRLLLERFTLKIILDFENSSMEDLWSALTWGK